MSPPAHFNSYNPCSQPIPPVSAVHAGIGWRAVAKMVPMEETTIQYIVVSRCHVQNNAECQDGLSSLNAVPYQWNVGGNILPNSNPTWVMFGTICGIQGTGDSHQAGLDVAMNATFHA